MTKIIMQVMFDCFFVFVRLCEAQYRMFLIPQVCKHEQISVQKPKWQQLKKFEFGYVRCINTYDVKCIGYWHPCQTGGPSLAIFRALSNRKLKKIPHTGASKETPFGFPVYGMPLWEVPNYTSLLLRYDSIQRSCEIGVALPDGHVQKRQLEINVDYSAQFGCRLDCIPH